MATVVVNGKSGEVPDGDQLFPWVEELGVPFGCTEGKCGTCLSEIEEGMENLSPKNEKEHELATGDNERLCCQSKILHGTVKIKC